MRQRIHNPLNRQTKTDLLQAAALLEAKGWTKHACAKNRFGCIVQIEDDEIDSFCVSGALRYITGHIGKDGIGLKSEERYLDAADAFADSVGTETIEEWNDDPSRTVNDAIYALRNAAISKRKKNPLNQQMIDIWDQSILLIEDRYNEWLNWMHGGGKSNLGTDDTTKIFAMEMTNRRDYFRSLSWYILQWAAIPVDSDQYEGIDESVRMLIETQQRQTDFTEVALIKNILRIVHDLEDPHDLTDYAFMIYQLYQICRYLLMFENMNPDRYRVEADLLILHKVGYTHGTINQILSLPPIPASLRAHQLTEAGQWEDIMLLWPPVGYQWMSFWVPKI